MNNFVPVEMENGNIVWVEVDESSRVKGDGFSLVSGEGQKALKGFEETVDALKVNAKYLLNQLSLLAPREVEVEFGIKIGVEGKTPFFALAKATGEANYSIRLKWVSEDASQPATGEKKD